MKKSKEKPIVLRTALAQIRYRKSTTILIGISIMLTAALLMMIGTCAYGLAEYNKLNIKTTSGDFHGSYARVNTEVYERIRNNTAFEKVGGSQVISEFPVDDMTGYLYAMDGDSLEMINRFPLTEGRLPGQGEIVAPGYLLKQMGYQGIVGEKISLRYRLLGKGEYVEQDFTVSGLTEAAGSSILSGNFIFLVSEQYADTAISEADRIRTVYFKIKEEENYDSDTMKAALKDITAELGIAEHNMQINSMYLLFVIEPNTEMIAAVAVLILIVVFFSALVIYNIFYVGMVGRIQEFGKIRAIGADKWQLGQMVLAEGVLIGGIAVPVGIMIGWLISNAGFQLLIYNVIQNDPMQSGHIRVSLWNPLVALMAAAIAFITIGLSLRKPMRIAARISPVEAIRHSASVKQAAAKGGKKASRKRNSRKASKADARLTEREVSLLRLTTANLARNKKRTVTTIMTLGLSSVLFITIANVGASMNAEDLTRRDMEKGDFLIALNYELNDITYPENNLNAMQERGLLGEDFVEAVKKIPGVSAVEVRRGVPYKQEVINSEGEREEEFGVISTVNREDWKKVEREFIAGMAEYEELAKQDGIAFTWGNEYWLGVYGYELGDIMSLSLLDGSREIPFTREIKTFCLTSDTDFIIPEESFAELGLEGNTNYKIYIDCEPGMLEEAGSELSRLVAADEAYVMQDYREQLKLSEFSIRLLVLPLYGLLVALGVIGFMNMANTIITSIITRRQELGILQAIGLTNRQMSNMLQMEGLVFTAGTLCLALTVGNVLGYAAYFWARENHMMAIQNYHFPVIENAAFVGALLFLQLVLSWICGRAIRKEGIIERIRHTE